MLTGHGNASGCYKIVMDLLCFQKRSFAPVCSDARVCCVCRVVMKACDSGGLQQVEEYVKLEMSPLKIIVT